MVYNINKTKRKVLVERIPELENLSFKTDFFYEEVRNGFYISEMMKRFWAAQLKVLSEIEKICYRHSIPWHIDMGSLIGAVRHKGYIPWDDDLDISMFRDDWERFFAYARKELPKGYLLLTTDDNEEWTLALGRVVNGDSIDYGKERMSDFYGCPYVVGVDIFPMDKIYNDKEKDEDRRKRNQEIVRAYTLISQVGTDTSEAKLLIRRIEKENNVVLHNNKKILGELMKLFTATLSECRDSDAREVASMYVWITERWANVPIEIYQESTVVQFEGTKVRIPKRYDELLRIYYGDYTVVKRNGGAHEYPVYKPQESALREKIGHNPFRYTFDKDVVLEKRNDKCLKEKIIDMLELLIEAHKNITELFINEDEAASELLIDCQNVAVSIGNVIDNKYGEGTKAVNLLEEYCEDIYRISLKYTEDTAGKLDNSIGMIQREICSLFDENKDILFLPCRYEWWNSMEPLYSDACKRKEYKVHVIPIPYYDCDYTGKLGERHDERDIFKEIIDVTDFDHYHLATKHPDKIVIQVPYDEWSCSIRVPEKIYSKNLLQFTDELVYLPCFNVDDPTDQDDKIAVALRSFIEQPAVIYADKVVLKSNAMRDLYIGTMTEIAGENTRNYWENKIVTIDGAL